MEDQVPFKVYTFWSENGKPEVRRFGVEKSLVTSFLYLNAKLQEIFPGLKAKTYSVAWKDEEDDDVTISSDDEVMTALTSMRSDLIKLNVYVKGGENKDDDKDDECDIVITAVSDNTAGANAVHYGVMCDACDSSVVGFRYKCTSCDDFDLCSKCEANGLHPEHCMVRVPTPSMPRTVIKAAIKRSRHFLKTVANAAAAGEECPYKRNKRERSSERKHRGGDHHGPHSGDHHRGERYHRRPRGSWLETFTTYMNEFANLAGDIDLDNTKKPGETTEPQGPHSQQRQQTSSENTQAPKEPKATSGDMPNCPFGPGNLNVQNIQKLLELYLGGNIGASAPQPSTSAASSNDASVNTNDVPTTNASVNTNDVEMSQDAEMGQGERQSSETDKVSIKSEVSSTSAESKRDESPDKADDWTVINKEKDLMDTYIKANAPSQPSAPIGFNLPEEFQERVQITEKQNIYPPLNMATAVLIPKEPKPQEKRTILPPQPTEQPQPKPAQPKPVEQPRQRHPRAHIEAAIQQMLSMGFTNDGGWLTQLLESKDGNIAAVLDLLTPVSPKK